MMRLGRGALALASCVVLGPSALSAQAYTAPIVLRIPAGPRSMAFGDAYTAGSGAEVLFYNPARLISAPGQMVSVGVYGSGARFGSMSTTLAVAGNFTAGAGVRYLEHGTAFAAPHLPEPGDLATAGSDRLPSVAATFGLAHTLPIIGTQAGVSVSYVAENTLDFLGSAHAVTLSAGITQPIGVFTFALAATDLSSSHLDLGSGQQELPERLSLGVVSQSFPVGDFIDITPIAQVSANRAHQVRPAAGVNFAYTPVIGFEFAARVGARWVDSTGVQKPSPFSFGLGFTLDRLSIDYAFEPDAAGAAHRIGLRAR